MILTVTLNAALDRIIFFDEFQPGTVMRTQRMLDKVGGKGLDASVALRTLGAETVALSFMAGTIGRRLAELLADYGVEPDLIWLAGETRLSHVLAEQRTQRHSHIIVGSLPVPESAWAELLRRYQARLKDAAWVVAAGTLPPGAPPTAYQTLIELARTANVPLLLDATGPPARETLAAPPTVLKMNEREFCQTFAVSAPSLAELHRQAQSVAGRYRLPALVITCGEQGILALTPTGDYLVAAPPQPVVNAAGAGDAASGTLAYRLAQGDSFAEALRWTAAVSAAVVLTEGTADCNLADIERLRPQVTLRAL